MKQLHIGNAILGPHGQQRAHIETAMLAILEVQFELKVLRGFNIHNIKQHFSPHWIPAFARMTSNRSPLAPES